MRNLPILFAMVLVTFSARAQPAEWPSLVTKQSIKMTVLKPNGFITNQPSPLIVYLENLAAPRVGSDSDDAIIRDFLNSGYVVVTLDYAHHPEARVPFINRDLGELRNLVRTEMYFHAVSVWGSSHSVNCFRHR